MPIHIIMNVESDNKNFNNFMKVCKHLDDENIVVYITVVLYELSFRIVGTRMGMIVEAENDNPLTIFINEIKTVSNHQLVAMLQVLMGDISERKTIVKEVYDG